MWEVFLLDKSDNFLYELPFEGISISFKLNSIHMASIRVNYYLFKKLVERFNDTIENALTGGFRVVEIKKNNILVFKGILSEISINKAQIDININLTVKSWLAYFQKRFITKTYQNVDAGQIAWDMINTAQQEPDGNIGITLGTIEATKNRDRTYKDDEIAKEIIGMAFPNIKDGFDFEISNEKVFNVKQRIGTDKPQIVVDEQNIETWNVHLWTGLLLCNQVISRGDGLGDNQPRTVVNAGSVYTNKWYLLEEVKNYLGVKKTDTLSDKANAYLDVKKEPFKSFNVRLKLTDISINDFDVGDSITVKIPDFVDGLYRIYEKTVQFSKDREIVSLEFLF